MQALYRVKKMDKNIAEKTSLLALKMGADLDNHLLMIK
jgi:hypothetical protein